MTAPLTDDDLGAALRAALQTLSPLATDPLPPPRFAPMVVLDRVVEPPAAVDDAGELVETGAPATVTSLTRRRLTVAAALLAVAAAAAVVVAVTTTDVRGRGNGRDPGPAAGPVTSTAPAAVPSSQAVVAPVGSVTAFPDVWRCGAPAGQAIDPSLQSDRIDDAQVWVIGAGVTCTARPDEAGKYVFESHGFSVPGVSPAQVGGTKSCITAWTQANTDDVIVSQGPDDYVEFYGPGCYLLLPDR